MRGDSGYDYSPESSYASPYADQEYSREALYESPYADREYREPHHDSYDEDNYGRDAYSVEPSYTYEEDDMENKRRKPRSVRYVQSRPTYWPWYRPYKTYKPYRTYWPTYRPTYKHKKVYGYGGDSYGKSYSTYSSYQPSYRHKRQASGVVVNREVSPGCFSSPPEDCGADCVASFSRDEGCYRCCCMESSVNATTCALPADGGDCRGNFERWAFNEATGDCEPFTYGGCGGNGNRFMCKEMCEHHCVEERVEKETRVSLGRGPQFESSRSRPGAPPLVDEEECGCQCSNQRNLEIRFGVPRFQGGCLNKVQSDNFCYVL